MDIEYCSLYDLKSLRPDLYLEIVQEVFLGKLKLTKRDIQTMIGPLAEKISGHLNPYLSKLSTMTSNEIVDMENDIIDEISEQLIGEFEELEDLVRKRLGDTKMENRAAKPKSIAQNEERIEEDADDNVGDDVDEVKVGYVLRLLPSQKIGCVVQVKVTKDGLRKLALKMEDNKVKEVYDNNLLYEIVRKNGKIEEGDSFEKKVKPSSHAASVNTSSIKEEKHHGDDRREVPVGAKEALVGDEILYDGKRCKVVGKKTTSNSMRLVIQYGDGSLDNVPNDWNRYSMANLGKQKVLKPAKGLKKKYDTKYKIRKRAAIGDWVMRTSDNQIGQVVEIRKLGAGIEKLIIRLEDGGESGVFNNTGLYWVLSR